MTLRMLIDANHPEETRVVVMKGNRLEEFDNESSTKKQLKGNIYLAKVTRVEPSLQAAFVEYGGNRHGFLAFAEIHPDYYQIPVADREALLREEAQQARHEAQLEDEAGARAAQREDAEAAESRATGDGNGNGNGKAGEENGAGASVEQVGQHDALDEVPRARPRPRRSYKIQEVIKKRQILLVQVVKEERGNKGAALTTYLSLAGRYCVLMPNTARGGGISRKITNMGARRKLKSVVADLDVPEGMGVIVRTAGMNRTKTEIKRDFESLLRQWDQVRETTLRSTAPTLVYEEASLIKRAIRDLYVKEIEEILVEGEDGYRAAKEVMRFLLPSHAKKVQPYREHIPLFHRYQAEQQLDGMHSNVVQLRSGGYIVINPTEALVAIDVNSGKSTREHHIEETALKTNLEASEEVARQLRLRDLAGLVVIDFIDMEDARNNRSVERRLKDSLKTDRARVQIGRISNFGLMELSRQRLRPSLYETSSVQCPHCAGSGYVRSTESAALHVLRAIEEEAVRERAAQVTVHVPTAIALYLLNQKRDHVNRIHERYGLRALIYGAEDLIPPNFRLEIDMLKSEGESAAIAERRAAVPEPTPAPVAEEDIDEPAVEEAEPEVRDGEAAEREGREVGERDDGRRRRGRRRRRRRP
ncbi:MAG: ribonuclease E/G, partial [Alphaproteobacteria bacterium]|nr:ribonuclease E/G [Alphaproteobacteria bacterium]